MTDVSERSGRVRVSAVIACYRDAEAVPVMHERLTRVFNELGVDYEIVFVNDGSPDNAREVLTELAARDTHVTAIMHTRPFGSQSAFTSGMRLATGDAVVLMDGDLQDPPEVIPELVEKWREGYDVVYGDRVDREGRRAMRTAYKLFYRLFRRTSYVDVPLDAGDFGLMDRRAVEILNRLPEKQRFTPRRERRQRTEWPGHGSRRSAETGDDLEGSDYRLGIARDVALYLPGRGGARPPARRLQCRGWLRPRSTEGPVCPACPSRESRSSCG